MTARPSDAHPREGRIRATYLLACAPGEDPGEKARDLAWEQTVELAPGSVEPEVEARAVGRIEALDEVDDGGSPGAGTELSDRDGTGVGGEPPSPRTRRFRAVVSHAPETCGDEIAQLLNLLWGNVSLKEGILLEGLELPAEVAAAHPGPRFGVEGIRAACRVELRRPLLCAALKPLGSSADGLARAARGFAEGGADLIKDDHSLADQPWAPFRERVRRCREAVADGNARSGASAAYVPHVTGGPSRIADRVAFARDEGCPGVLVNAVPAGLPALAELAGGGDLFVLAHPSLAGGFFGRQHGIAPDVLLGTLFRLAGADGVIFPNPGGRFPFNEATCRSIVRRLREPLGGLRASAPVPGGGIDVERIPRWAEAYGPDTVFLVGGGLYVQGDLAAATRRLADVLAGYAAG